MQENLTLNEPMKFHGSIDWLPNGSGFAFDFDPGTSVILSRVTADSYSYNSSESSLFQDSKDILDLHLNNPTGGPPMYCRLAAEWY
jgi:hypothetical protein